MPFPIHEYLQIEQTEDGNVELTLSGRLSFSTVEPLRNEIEKALKKRREVKVTVHLDQVEYIDSAGAALLFHIKRYCRKRDCETVRGRSNVTVEEALKLFDLEKIPEIKLSPEKSGNIIVYSGKLFIKSAQEFIELSLFIGRVFLALMWSLRHPGRFRWGEIIYLSQRTGAEALPIVGLLSLLIGLVSAFSSAVQLRQFGANIYIADLIGIGMTREMGPLITAILITGRSGSAFAAEIGTMKISDEIDALTVMGIDPHHYLALPRIIAVMLMMPLLTLFSDLFGIAGGLFISVATLDLTPTAFMNQLGGAIGLWDVASGLLKAFVFGILVAGTGCFRGLQTYGGALAVGKSTTSSVVSGIFLIVAADSAFAIVFHYLGLM